MTLLQTPFGELDNMEGISVWSDPRGADARHADLRRQPFPLQRTMFAEYVLVEG